MTVKNDRLMKRSFGDIDIFLSPEFFESVEWIAKLDGFSRKENFKLFADVLSSMNFDNRYVKLIEYNMSIKKLPIRKAALCAHGGFYDGEWVYYNNGTPQSIQSWINKKDGQYSLLMINPCNPVGAEVQSKKSAILLPNDDFSAKDLEDGLLQLELYIPKAGYIDNYTVDEYFADPKKMYSKRKD
jgi:hypothetical protein